MLLEMRNITKIYGETIANDNVNISLKKGEILAIVGENGAGKSTIMKVLYGLEKADGGEIFLNGKKTNFKDPQDAIQAGIGMVQQHFMLFSPFTVAENIVYGNEPKSGMFFDRNEANKIVNDLSKKYGLMIDPKEKVSDCPVGLQQRIEILKVLYQDADIIIFDEPSAVLTPQEVTELLRTIKNLSKLGKSIIIITHKLQEVMEIADRVTVMRRGKHVKDLIKSETSIEELSYLMVGRNMSEREITPIELGDAILEVEDLNLELDGKSVLKNINMKIYGGEIVGIAGVSGNGQSELIRVLTGLLKADSGKVTINGKDVLNSNVRDIREFGLACIPEDRYLWGCASQADLIETAIMHHHKHKKFSNRGILNTDECKNFTEELIENYDVRTSGVSQKAGELSGGNIQKLVVAREIEQKSPFLIAAEPTRGIDIGAMEDIHEKLLDKRNEGDAVLLVSSELTEIMGLSDRIYVLYEGRITGEFKREDANSETLGLYMTGGRSDEKKI
ncbi:MAG: ABC transporter ATP-binding protein [Tissierellia bacterium]|nr:ABC transporter ATP-binding protein [Tissierellia bacterium]